MGSTADADGQGPGVLVVEDDDALRDLLLTILESEGYVPTGASNGRAALAHLDAGLQPALILLDMRMPVMDGWAFLEHYSTRAGPHAPVLVVTAVARNGHHLPVAGLLTKPFSVDELVRRVHALAPVPPI